MTKTPIDPAERQQIKAYLMRTFDEPDKGIAVMIAVVVARIARFDWPRHWEVYTPLLYYSYDIITALGPQF
jgi:hypothetical protein